MVAGHKPMTQAMKPYVYRGMVQEVNLCKFLICLGIGRARRYQSCMNVCARSKMILLLNLRAPRDLARVTPTL